MNDETHLLPEKRAFVCVDCGYRTTDSSQPHACPRCGETMQN